MEQDLSFAEKILLRKKEYLTSLAAILAGVAVLVIYSQSGPKAEHYALAEEAVEKWEASPKDETLYLEMRRALHKVPSLERKYEAAVVQHLFDKKKIDEALQTAFSVFQRVEGDAPFHSAYAETTLLIERGEFQAALEKTVALKGELEKGLDFRHMKQEPLVGGSVLYAYNLLRIAVLQNHLNNHPGEKAAWGELEAFLDDKRVLSQIVYGNFKEKGLDLTDYITERKKEL